MGTGPVADREASTLLGNKNSRVTQTQQEVTTRRPWGGELGWSRLPGGGEMTLGTANN